MNDPHCCSRSFPLLQTGALLLAVALLLPARPAAGQRVFNDAANDLKHGLGDVVHVWTAPARMSTSDLEGLGLVVGVGGLLLLSDGPIQRWVDDHPSSAVVGALEPFREEAALESVGDIWYTFRYSAAAWLAGLAFDSETVREAAMGCMAAGVAQTIPRRLVLYEGIARTRPRFTDDPYEFAIPGESDWSRRSFPGGHAANAFTCISFLGNRYSLGVLEPVLYAAAAGAAIARVPDGAHWASDTWIGMALGYAVGRAVAMRAADRADRAESADSPDGPDRHDPDGWQLQDLEMPPGLMLGVTPDGLQLTWIRRF